MNLRVSSGPSAPLAFAGADHPPFIRPHPLHPAEAKPSIIHGLSTDRSSSRRGKISGVLDAMPAILGKASA